MKILIVEDELAIIYTLERVLKEYFNATVYNIDNYEEFKTSFDESKYDLIVMDVFLGENNILEDIHKVLSIEKPCIFITSYPIQKNFSIVSQYDKAAFLIKPFHDLTFVSSVKNLMPAIKQYSKFLNITDSRRKKKKINVDDIHYVEVRGNYSVIYTQTITYVIKKSLNSLINCADGALLKINKHTAINLQKYGDDLKNKKTPICVLDKKIVISNKFIQI